MAQKLYRTRFAEIRLTRICTIVLVLLVPGLSCMPRRLFSPRSTSADPRTAITTWPLPELHKIMAADIAHGQKQVEQMIQDHPAMAACAEPNGSILAWCVRQFAGAVVGQRITWDNGVPMAASDGADHIGPDGDTPGSLRLSNTLHDANGGERTASGEELWAGAVYELNNMVNDPEFDRIDEQACAGKLDKSVYIEQVTRLEYVASLKTAQVYRHLWPSAQSQSENNPAAWCANIPDTYEEWIAAYTDKSSYPWDSWGTYYHDDMASYRKSIGQ